MSIYIDRKFLLLVSHRLEQFKQKKEDLYNFRCPVCGDSQKNKLKARAYVYRKKNDYYMSCHNCHVGLTMYNFLKHVDASTLQEYSLERFANNETTTHNYPKKNIVESFKFSTPKFKTKQKLALEPISKLNSDHFAKAYVLGRGIPKERYNDLYFAQDFKKFIDDNFPGTSDKLIDNDPRLVIPFYDTDGNIFTLQGRSLSGNKLRYITIKLKEFSSKIFGLDKINTNETIYVVEGPIDSLFLTNCIATADSNLTSASSLFDKEKLVLVYDREPRNKEIVKQIEKSIKQGFNVCLFPDTIEGKDINEMILSGIKKEEIMTIIDKCTYSGPRAEMEFSIWKKC